MNVQQQIILAHIREQLQKEKNKSLSNTGSTKNVTDDDDESTAEEGSALPLLRKRSTFGDSSDADNDDDDNNNNDKISERQQEKVSFRKFMSSSITLPSLFTHEEDDCDEAEKLARAKRIEEIMRLSAEVKAKEAEKERVANIRPLSWAKPTFDYLPSTNALGKRKVQQEQSPKNSPDISVRSSYTRPSGEGVVEASADFSDKKLSPSIKRRSIEQTGDN